MEILPTELPQYWPILFDSDFGIVAHNSGMVSIDPALFFEGAAPYRPFRNFFKITENTEWFPRYEEVLNLAKSEMDQAKRKELYHEAFAIALEEGWTITLGYRQEIYATTDVVKGFKTDLEGMCWLDEVWLAE